MAPNLSPIQSYFSQRSVFITGATGFLGKAVAAKLLRSCPTINKVYILIRPKKGVDIQERFHALIKAPIISRLMNENPETISKLVPLAGDITQPGLGLSSKDSEAIKENASVFIHSAASIKFNQPLGDAVENVAGGAYRFLELARSSKNVSSVVHVSSAFLNLGVNQLEEKTVSRGYDASAALKLFPSLQKLGMLEKITPDLLGHLPNTYCLSKCLAENIVEEEARNGLPVCIVRPSAISASWKDPFPGWCDSTCASVGIVLGGGLGAVKAYVADKNHNWDLLPLEYVVNCILAAAWKEGTKKNKDFVIYNNVRLPMKDFNVGLLKEYSDKYFPSTPFENCITYPEMPRGVSSQRMASLVNYFQVYPAAIGADLVDRIQGRVPKNKKVFKLNMQFFPLFAGHDIIWKCENFLALRSSLSQADRKLFNLDIEKIDWDDYFPKFILGIRRYVLRQDDATIEDSKARLRRLRFTVLLYRSMFASALIGATGFVTMVTVNTYY